MNRYRVYEINYLGHKYLMGETYATSKEKAISNLRFRRTKNIKAGLYGNDTDIKFYAEIVR